MGAGSRRRVWNTALTGLSQALGFLGVAGLGLLIASQFGATASTDGFFIAQSVYGVVLLMAQSLRTTAVGELTQRPQTSVRETLGAVVVLALFAGAAFIAVAVALVPALTADLPDPATATAQTSLLLLWPASALMLLSGALAALLATRDDVAFAAASYSLGTFVGLLSFVPLQSVLGIQALPVVLLTGALVTAAMLGIRVRRTGGAFGVRPAVRPVMHRARRLLLGSAGLIVGQLVVTTSVGLAGRIGEQSTTTYSYGMMAVGLVTATAVSPAMIVLAPVLASEWRGGARELAALTLKVFRFGALLVVPLVAGVVLVGAPVLELLMPESSRRTVPQIVAVILALSPTVLATLMVIVPELGLVTRGRFSVLAIIGAGTLTVHVIASLLVVVAGGGVADLAAVAGLSAICSAVIVTSVSISGHRSEVFGGVLRALAQLVAVPVAGYVAISELIGGVDEFGAGLLAWLAGTTFAAGWLLIARRAEVVGAVQLVTGRGG